MIPRAPFCGEKVRASAKLQEQRPLSTQVLVRYLTLRFPLLYVGLVMRLAVLLHLAGVVLWPLRAFVSTLSVLGKTHQTH